MILVVDFSEFSYVKRNYFSSMPAVKRLQVIDNFGESTAKGFPSVFLRKMVKSRFPRALHQKRLLRQRFSFSGSARRLTSPIEVSHPIRHQLTGIHPIYPLPHLNQSLFVYSAVLDGMNSAFEVKDSPSEDIPLDEEYLGMFTLVKCYQCSN